MKIKTCENYCGVACIDGSCPKIPDDYSEFEFINPYAPTCKECPYNHGCNDCCMVEMAKSKEYCL